MCNSCEHCFCPELRAWTDEQFSTNIYNDDYHKADPEYLSGHRAKTTFANINALLGNLTNKDIPAQTKIDIMLFGNSFVKV